MFKDFINTPLYFLLVLVSKKKSPPLAGRDHHECISEVVSGLSLPVIVVTQKRDRNWHRSLRNKLALYITVTGNCTIGYFSSHK